jgi:hypothetical protein
MFVDPDLPSKDAWKMLRTEVDKRRADYITSSVFSPVSLFRDWRSIRNATIGPIVTIRNLSMMDLNSFKGFTGWSPSTGDLELF